jgi:hypothetical protein
LFTRLTAPDIQSAFPAKIDIVNPPFQETCLTWLLSESATKNEPSGNSAMPRGLCNVLPAANGVAEHPDDVGRPSASDVVPLGSAMRATAVRAVETYNASWLGEYSIPRNPSHSLTETVTTVDTAHSISGSSVVGTGVGGAGVCGTGVCGTGVGGTGVGGTDVGGTGVVGEGVGGAGVGGTDVGGEGVGGAGVGGTGVGGTGVGGDGVVGAVVVGAGVVGLGHGRTNDSQFSTSVAHCCSAVEQYVTKVWHGSEIGVPAQADTTVAQIP